ncbi:MAG: hypothetical protein ACE5K8_04655 [Candidatus Zixiibacteriota bacterium]
MKIRREYLEKSRTISDSQTLVVDMPITDPISAITVIYEANNGGTSNQGVYLHDDVDSIELVDGSEEIFSLNGIETLVLNCFELKKWPYALLTEAADSSQYEAFTMHFGRYIGDPLYWLDPGEFRNLQVRLAHSLTISATAGFATGTGSVDVIAHVFADRPASRNGYFIAKEQYSFTSAASGDEKISLPTDYPYRLLIQRMQEDGIAINTDITNVKLNAGGGAFVPVDMDTLDIVQLNAGEFGEFELFYDLLRTDGDSDSFHLHDIRGYVANAVNDLDVASVDAQTVNTLTLQLLSLTTTPGISKSTTDTQIGLRINGYCPFGSIVVPLGDPNDPETWFDPTLYGSVDLVLTQGAAGATCNTILQQVRR